jgi:hypothetical protein
MAATSAVSTTGKPRRWKVATAAVTVTESTDDRSTRRR